MTWKDYFENFDELERFCDRMSQDEIGVPKHLYHNPSSIMFIVQYGAELGMTPAQSMVSLIPMKGYLCMLGDAMKAKLFKSDYNASWQEIPKGSFVKDNYSITIKAKRQEPDGEKFKVTAQAEKTFTQEMFIRAGLVVSKEHYTKMKNSLSTSEKIRFEYPEQTMYYILQGWMLRDLYPDVFGLVRSFDEVRHYKNYEFKLTPDGDLTKVTPRTTIEAMETLNNSVVQKIVDKEAILKKRGHRLVMGEDSVIIKDKYTEEEIDSCKAFSNFWILKKIVEALDIYPRLLPGDNNFKKFKPLVMAHQKGHDAFKAYIDKTYPKHKKGKHSPYSRYMIDKKRIIKDAPEKKTPIKMEYREGNVLEITIPDFEDGTNQREITDVGGLVNELRDKIDIDDADFIDSMTEIPNGELYINLITFCRLAPRAIINGWINKNKK